MFAKIFLLLEKLSANDCRQGVADSARFVLDFSV